MKQMVNVHYFASLRERLGTASEELELPAGVGTIAGLIDHLAGNRGERWRATLDDNAVLVAINQSVVKRSAAIRDGDEVAFFPPVTGG